MTRRKTATLLAIAYGTTLSVLTLWIGCPLSTGPQTHPEPRPKVFAGHRFPIQTLTFSPDSTTLTTAAFFSGVPAALELFVWDVRTVRCRVKHTIPPGDLVKLCLLPGNGRFAAFGTDQGVWLGDTASARRLGETAEAVFAVACSPEAGLLATADISNVVTLWDLASGRLRICYKATVPLRALTFAPDGKTLAGGGNDKVIQLWEVATGKERAILPGHTHPVWAVAFSPDGRLLASGDMSGVVKIWNVATAK